MNFRLVAISTACLLIAAVCVKPPAVPSKPAPIANPPDIEIARKMHVVGNKAILEVTFKNNLDMTTKLTVSKMNANLYEPLAGIPAVLKIPIAGSKTLRLEYPIAAARRNPTENRFVTGGVQLEDDVPALNYAYKAESSGTGAIGASSADEYEMRPPDPSLLDVMKTKEPDLSISNDYPTRTLDFRLDSVSGTDQIKTPLMLKVPPKSTIPLTNVKLKDVKGTLTFKYSFRLEPNKTWMHNYQSVNFLGPTSKGE